MTGPTSELDDLVRGITDDTAILSARVRNQDPTALRELIDLAFFLLDRSFLPGAQPVMAALDVLDRDSLLSDAERGWLMNLHARERLVAGDNMTARRILIEARQIAEGHPTERLLGTTLLNLGNTNWTLGRLEEAVRNYEDSYTARGGDDDFGRAQALINLAGVYLQQGAPERASETIARAERLAASGRRWLRASLTGVKGLIASDRGDLDEAERLFRLSATYARRAATPGHLVIALQNVGAANLDLGRIGKAIRWLRRAERAAIGIGELQVLDSIQRTLSTALHRSNRTREARRVLERARAQAIDLGNEPALARVSADWGSLDILTGDLPSAVDRLEHAFEWFVGSGDRDWTKTSALNLAAAYIRTDQEPRGYEALARASTALGLGPVENAGLHETLGDLLLAAGRSEAAARAYGHGGRFLEATATLAARDYLTASGAKLVDTLPTQALSFFTRALDLPEVPGAVVNVYRVRNDRALVFIGLDRLEDATVDLEIALRGADEAGDRAMQSIVLGNLSEVVRRRGESGRAMEYGEGALRIARETGNLLQEADALATLGLAMSLAGDSAAARRIFRESLVLARSLKATEPESVALGGLAQLDFAAGHYLTARKRYRAAAAIERRQGDPLHVTESLAAIIETDAALRDVDAFESDLQLLIDLVQRGDGSVAIAETGIGRAGGMWLRARRTETAGETFAAGILLSLWDSTRTAGDEAPATVARSLVAPYVYARREEFAALERLEDAIRSVVRENAGRRGERFLAQMLPVARDAVS